MCIGNLSLKRVQEQGSVYRDAVCIGNLSLKRVQEQGSVYRDAVCIGNLSLKRVPGAGVCIQGCCTTSGRSVYRDAVQLAAGLYTGMLYN